MKNELNPNSRFSHNGFVFLKDFRSLTRVREGKGRDKDKTFEWRYHLTSSLTTSRKKDENRSHDSTKHDSFWVKVRTYARDSSVLFILWLKIRDWLVQNKLKNRLSLTQRPAGKVFTFLTVRLQGALSLLDECRTEPQSLVTKTRVLDKCNKVGP